MEESAVFDKVALDKVQKTAYSLHFRQETASRIYKAHARAADLVFAIYQINFAEFVEFMKENYKLWYWIKTRIKYYSEKPYWKDLIDSKVLDKRIVARHEILIKGYLKSLECGFDGLTRLENVV